MYAIRSYYVCEALGLQGRLDYMQRDMRSFIEMKSGKADEYAIKGKIEPKENNLVHVITSYSIHYTKLYERYYCV